MRYAEHAILVQLLLEGSGGGAKATGAANSIAAKIMGLVSPRDTRMSSAPSPACGDGGDGAEADDPRVRPTVRRTHSKGERTAHVPVGEMSCAEATEHMVVGHWDLGLRQAQQHGLGARAMHGAGGACMHVDV